MKKSLIRIIADVEENTSCSLESLSDEAPEAVKIVFKEPPLVEGIIPERNHAFILNTKQKTGTGKRPLFTYTKFDPQQYDLITEIFAKYGWKIENESDNINMGGMPKISRGRVRVPNPEYCR